MPIEDIIDAAADDLPLGLSFLTSALLTAEDNEPVNQKWSSLDVSTANRYADCHIHSTLCGHAKHTLSEMLEGIRVSGLRAAIFTEHLPLPEEIDPNREVSMRFSDLEPYVATLKETAEKFDYLRSKGEDAPRLIVGAEADWLNQDPDWSRQSVKEARAAGVDVVLGSVHMLDGWAFDDPAQVEEWDRRDTDEVWDFYFSEWIKAVKSGLYDVMAHPDLPKKFAFIPADPREYYHEAAAAIAGAGILCEVSTGGLRKPCKELYPSQDFLQELVRLNVGLTLGSDAHSIPEIGYGFDYAAEQLLKTGASHQSLPTGPVHEGKIELLLL
ncbi:MAG: histidinol-phosphatase HisJ family protein [Coriobacteriia bacterium]|nr:histidinol-phosphatase HisJ family protein [Coriobacteriia bacterium]